MDRHADTARVPGSRDRHTNRRRCAIATLVAATTVIAAGCSDTTDVVAASLTAGAPSTSTTATSIPDYPQNPGDILSLSNLGVADTVFAYEDYPQMRDYSDTVVLATFVGHHPLTQPTPDGVLPGELQLDFTVDDVLGGQTAPAGDTVSIVVPLDGSPTIQREVFDRLTAMHGRARYVLFLRRATPIGGNADLYVPNLYNGPDGVLAVWPGDGRLSGVTPSDDLSADARRRGEELTGTTSPPFEPSVPRFEGQPPVGMTVHQVLAEFARPSGTAETPPPSGWEGYKELDATARQRPSG